MGKGMCIGCKTRYWIGTGTSRSWIVGAEVWVEVKMDFWIREGKNSTKCVRTLANLTPRVPRCRDICLVDSTELRRGSEFKCIRIHWFLITVGRKKSPNSGLSMNVCPNILKNSSTLCRRITQCKWNLVEMVEMVRLSRPFWRIIRSLTLQFHSFVPRFRVQPIWLSFRIRLNGMMNENGFFGLNPLQSRQNEELYDLSIDNNTFGLPNGGWGISCRSTRRDSKAND